GIETETETETETDYYVAHWVVNSTGFSAPALAEKCGDGVPPLQAYRGEYYVLDKETRGYVKHVLYPVPTSLSKGILVSPTPEGNILVGPNFEPVKPGDTSTTVQGLAEVKIGAQKLVHHLPFDRTIQIFAGIRSVLPERDFHIFFSHRFSNIVHLCGIESPGLTASFGIAEYVGELLEKRGLNLVHKAHFNLRKNAPIFSECSWEERERLITQDPDWGRLVCRCEEVTLAEVKRALFVPPSARTIDGLKRRTRVTAGRCQGSFCEMHLLSTMIAFLGFSENDIRKSGIHSHCLVGETREE
ncbi:MAG: FAD-dependent oxidoreductase, partial [Atribacterota bacterium]